MATFRETIYTNSENELILGMFQDGKPFEANQLTRARLICENLSTGISSELDSDTESAPIWNFDNVAQVGDTHNVTVITLVPGTSGLPVGVYTASLFVYYGTYEGLFWDSFFLIVKDVGL